MNPEVVIVSGLPRSGTSLMMQLLGTGGISLVIDDLRAPDADNPRGYFEFQPVKKTKHDVSWLPGCRGKVVKMVSQLLYELPPTEQYQIVFMERDLDEVLESQEKMLTRLGQPSVPRDEMIRAFTLHLDRLHAWLAEQPHMAVLRVDYANVVSRPEAEIDRINEFLGWRLNPAAACQTIDPALYRNRKAHLARRNCE